MCNTVRRDLLRLGMLGVCAAVLTPAVRATAAEPGAHRAFVAEAERMKAIAIAAGDQPFGAIVVLAGGVVGFGPSRVIVDRNQDAHAERVAIADAQLRLGRDDIAGAILYSTSRPCKACEAAAARARIARMIFGAAAIEAGPPRMP